MEPRTKTSPVIHQAVGTFRVLDRKRVSLYFDPAEGRTKSEFKDECDINVIMRRYEKTGVLPELRKEMPNYEDVSGHDFREAMELITEARSAFAELPSRVRERFRNDPAELLDFMQNPDVEEAAELGLLSDDAMRRLGEAQAAAAAAPGGAPEHAERPQSTSRPEASPDSGGTPPSAAAAPAPAKDKGKK